jgi:hypothetical protein
LPTPLRPGQQPGMVQTARASGIGLVPGRRGHGRTGRGWRGVPPAAVIASAPAGCAARRRSRRQRQLVRCPWVASSTARTGPDQPRRWHWNAFMDPFMEARSLAARSGPASPRDSARAIPASGRRSSISVTSGANPSERHIGQLAPDSRHPARGRGTDRPGWNPRSGRTSTQMPAIQRRAEWSSTTCSRRAANISMASATGSQATVSVQQSTLRSASAPGAPPGSRVRSTGRPASAKAEASRRASVVFPAPSPPSSVMKRAFGPAWSSSAGDPAPDHRRDARQYAQFGRHPLPHRAASSSAARPGRKHPAEPTSCPLAIGAGIGPS